MAKRHFLTVEYVRQCLRYEDGKLFWIKRPLEHFADKNHADIWNSRFTGKESGYDSIRIIKGTLVKRHIVCINYAKATRYQIVWLLHKNEWLEEGSIDHANTDSLDDRIENLRQATRNQQSMNMKVKRNNTSGHKGVHYDKARGKYMSFITINGKMKNLGRFDTIEEAIEVRRKRAKEIHGEFYRES